MSVLDEQLVQSWQPPATWSREQVIATSDAVLAKPAGEVRESEDIFRLTALGLDWDIGVRVYEPQPKDTIAHGADGIGALYDRLCETARALHEAVARRPEFEALHEPESNILCFRWRGAGRLDGARLDALNLRLREGYNRSGEGWITTTLVGGRRVLRCTVMNPRTTTADVERVLDGLAALASSLSGVRS